VAVAAAALILVAAAGSAGALVQTNEGRNFDARIQVNSLVEIAPTASQLQAVEGLRQQIPELGVEFDPAMGTTRTLYNQVGLMTKASSGDPMDLALEFVQSHLDTLGLTRADLESFEVTDVVHSSVSGATHIYLRQKHEGLAVYNGQLHINVNKNGQIMSVNNAFVAGIANAINTTDPVVGPMEAVNSLARQLGIAANVRQTPSKKGDQEAGGVTLTAEELSVSEIDPRLMWLPIGAGDVRLVWNFRVDTPDSEHMFDTTVDAVSGEVWTRFDFVSSDSFRVYPEPVESPNDTSPLPPADARVLIVNPEDATASPNDWFSGSGIMDGNNVHACADVDRNNVCDSPQPQCSGGTCSFGIDLTTAPGNSQGAAITNLFYWNNIIHDIQYQYGFTESAGNFQENNFGRGGSGSDSVNADAQDTSFPSPCNANFGTPPDGSNPRMQMFLCDNTTPDRDGDYDNGVIVHEYGHGISTRQVGGPSNSGCLGNNQQAGEGWSDFFALVYTARASHTGATSRGLGSYLFNTSVTIRDLPYSTSSSVNNWTYQSISGASIPHGVGSRWAQAIWEVYWALVDEHGFESDLVNFDINDSNEAGNKRALYYVNEGLKNTACSPTFTQNRDGIIQAATNSFGGADVCRIWEAFAAFGLGTNASSGGSNSTNPTNGFNIPASCDDPPPTCENVLHAADFEGSADGWTNNGSSTCSTGTFVQGAPTQIVNSGVTTQVAGAASGSGAWFTATNSSAGVNDVDGGTCDTRSPAVSAAAGQVTVSFDYFHGQRDGGDDGADGFVVDVLNNGSVVSTIVNIGDSTTNAAWTPASTTFNLASAGNLQLRVRATDGSGGGDLIEGGIDNVQICGGDGGPPTGGCTVDDDFESGSAGWSNSGASTCTTGAYVEGAPTQQTSTIVTQVGGDHTPGGGNVNALFTASNTSAGNADVDGGVCILDSPTWSVTNASTLSVWYFHGQRDTGDDPGGDFFQLQVSTNGGSSYSNIVNIGDVRTVAQWTNATATIPAGSNVKVRVRTSDGSGPGDIVEGGIDDLSICDN